MKIYWTNGENFEAQKARMAFLRSGAPRLIFIGFLFKFFIYLTNWIRKSGLLSRHLACCSSISEQLDRRLAFN